MSQLLNVVFSSKRIRLYAWLSLVSQILIVVTGGVVRLTGSGLGCPTWPKCTDDSLVTVPEMGIHGVIEFANRLLTFVLLVIALLTWATVLRNRKRPSSPAALLKLSTVLLLSIPAQAILGGITVITKLNPWSVGAHFVLSAIMIAVAATLVFRVYRPEHLPLSPRLFALANPSLVVGWVTVLVGVLVTGAGPHSGDAQSVRNGLDLELWQHVHSYPAYLSLALSVWVTIEFCRRDGRLFGSVQGRVSFGLTLMLAAQALIGVMQARLGVPPVLVALHMLGASVLVALYHMQWLLIRGKQH